MRSTTPVYGVSMLRLETSKSMTTLLKTKEEITTGYCVDGATTGKFVRVTGKTKVDLALTVALTARRFFLE